MTIIGASWKIKAMRYFLAIAAIISLAFFCTSCGKEVKDLQEELKVLKEENNFLKAENIALKKEIEELYKKIEEKDKPKVTTPVPAKTEEPGKTDTPGSEQKKVETKTPKPDKPDIKPEIDKTKKRKTEN